MHTRLHGYSKIITLNLYPVILFVNFTVLLLPYQISNFFIGLYFLSFVNKFGISTVYFGFGFVCLLAVLYVARNIVETKGRSLEEIEQILSATA